MKKLLMYLLMGLCIGCQYEKKTTENLSKEKNWLPVDSIDVKAFNEDLVAGKPTMDIGIYFPNNFDPKFNKVTLEKMMASLQAAKEIYQPTGVQINLLWVKTGYLDPRHFSIQANEIPQIPATEYTNMYEHALRHPSVLTESALGALEEIIEPGPNNDRTIYLIALQEVFFPFLEVSDGRNWTIKSVRTGGLSFPSYSYPKTIPAPYRGAITITNLSRSDRLRRTIAHELGHKVMNVSHEYKSTNPGHEVYADGGLMLYGSGEEIPSGKEGRWHLERLHASPFLYKLNEHGQKQWNKDFLEGGHYYDPIYGNHVVHFDGVPPIDEDW